MRDQIQQLINKFPNDLEVIVDNSLYLYTEQYQNNIKERVFFNFSNEIPYSIIPQNVKTTFSKSLFS